MIKFSYQERCLWIIVLKGNKDIQLKPLIIIVLSIVFFGCATPTHPFKIKDESIINSNDKGVLVLSVKYGDYGSMTRGVLINAAVPSFFAVSKAYDEFLVIHRNYEETIKFSGKGRDGYIIALALPAKEYEITKWSQTYDAGFNKRWEESENEFSIPFTIEAGVLNYIGQISLDNYTFHFHNEKERDLNSLFQKYPFLKKMTIREELLACSPSCETTPKLEKEEKLFIMPTIEQKKGSGLPLTHPSEKVDFHRGF